MLQKVLSVGAVCVAATAAHTEECGMSISQPAEMPQAVTSGTGLINGIEM